MADDQIIIEYKAKLDKLESDLNRLEKDLKGVDTASKKSMNTLEKEGKEAAKSVDKVNKEVSGLGSKLQNLAGNIPGVFAVQEVLSFGSALTGSTKAAGGLSSGMKVLKVAIASTGIGLLVVALVALIAYFKRTDDGATKLEGIMGALGAAMDEVTGFVAELGGRIYDAATSFDSFKEVVADASLAIGKYILNRIGAPVFLIIDLFKAAGKAIEGDFKGATAATTDALIRFATGFENVTEKVSNFSARVAKSAKEAYDFALAMDAISDAERKNSTTIAENNQIITKNIIASKAKNATMQKSLELLDEASAKETENLKLTLDLEEMRLVELVKRNKTKKDSINQDANARLLEIQIEKAAAKTEEEKNKLIAEELKIKKNLHDINDDLLKEEVDQRNKIIDLHTASAALQEKISNRRIAEIEQGIQKEIAAANIVVIAKQNIQKQALLDEEAKQREAFSKGLINEETYLKNLEKANKDYQKAIGDATIEALEKEKLLLEKYGLSTVEIEAKILDIKLKANDEEVKGYQDDLKQKQKDSEEFAKFEKELNDDVEKNLAQAREERRKKDEADEKQHQANMKAILGESITFAGNLLNGINQRKLDNDLSEIESERNKNQLQLNSAIALIDKKEAAGLLSETTAAAQKEALQKKAAKKESELKKKQFEAQKKADLTGILINTAVSIAKTFATYGFTPPGWIAAAAAAAEGALQYAFVSSKKTPAFKDGVIDFKGKGTGTSDENHVMISNRESIIKAKQSIKYKGLLGAINEDRVDDYFMKDPAGKIMAQQMKDRLKEKQLSEAALRNQANKIDFNLEEVERRLKSNKTVNIGNADQIASLIAKKINGNNNPEMK